MIAALVMAFVFSPVGESAFFRTKQGFLGHGGGVNSQSALLFNLQTVPQEILQSFALKHHHHHHI